MTESTIKAYEKDPTIKIGQLVIYKGDGCTLIILVTDVIRIKIDQVNNEELFNGTILFTGDKNRSSIGEEIIEWNTDTVSLFKGEVTLKSTNE